MLFILSILSFSAGIVMIMASIWALQKNSGAFKILALLSPILTYGILVCILLLTPSTGIISQLVLIICIALCVILNGYTFFSFWNWIEPRKKSILFTFLSGVVLVSVLICFLIAPTAQFCAKASLPGKGTPIENIQYCQTIGLYAPGDHPWPELFPFIAITALAGPLCVYILLTITYIRTIYTKPLKKKH